MTYLDAAHEILAEANQPLHYSEITQRALVRNLITPTGQTPAATMGSRLYTDTLNEETRFVRIGRGIFELAKKQPGGIDAQVQQINQATRDRLRDLLSTMPPERFEALITELLIQMGFDERTVTVTPYNGDGGIDVIGVYRAAGLTEVNAAVQVKRWKRNIQSPIITQLRGSLQVHQQGIIITTSDFSTGARAEAGAANKTRIGLINGDELLDLLIKHRVGVTEKTLRVIGLDDEWWGELLAKKAIEPPAKEPHVKETVAPIVLPQGPTGRKPVAIHFLDEEHGVASWKDLLLTVCTRLAVRHETTFEQHMLEIHGRKRNYISPSPDSMLRAAAIPGTRLWVETNLSAQAILKFVGQLLQAFGHGENKLVVAYEMG